MYNNNNNNNNNKLRFFAIIIAVITLTLNACKKDELPAVEEEELITTISLTFTNTTNSSDKRTITWRDLDGAGGNNPVISPLTLSANAVYNVAVTSVLNETESPAEDIRAEVAEENDEHLFVYKVAGANISFSNYDRDANNLQVGLSAKATTTTASSGTFTIVLRHQPGGIKNGTEAPGSTDLEAVFQATVAN